MCVHENARTTPYSRMLIIARLAMGQSVAAVAVSVDSRRRSIRPAG